ncbi:MAG: hypothetical protein FJ100_18145 [Deltaproteobacteria bacterium]|nr:hypothetical protein [Deltaproteobacteria bacterium]
MKHASFWLSFSAVILATAILKVGPSSATSSGPAFGAGGNPRFRAQQTVLIPGGGLFKKGQKPIIVELFTVPAGVVANVDLVAGAWTGESAPGSGILSTANISSIVGCLIANGTAVMCNGDWAKMSVGPFESGTKLGVEIIKVVMPGTLAGKLQIQLSGTLYKK